MFETSAALSRRRFLSQATYLGAAYAVAQSFPLPAMATRLADDPRIAATPVVDAGFASVRKIGEGLYATISDTTKGLATLCNGGILIGKDSALLLEGFATPEGAAFQMDALRKVSQTPVQAALDTHYHFDHSMGNSFYGTKGIPLWAHANVSKRIVDSYLPLQTLDKETILAPAEKRVADAKSETQKQHAQSDVNAFTIVTQFVKQSALTLPNRALDPAKLPMTVDLGNLAAVIETHPGHSGTDVIVRVPDQKVVYTGDLLFNHSYPVCFDDQGTVSGWRATLKKFAGYDKDTIFVPGHGALCGQETIQLFRETFDDIAEQAEKMHKAGVPVEEAMERYIVPEKYKTLGIFAWGFTIGPAISKLYAEWGAK